MLLLLPEFDIIGVIDSWWMSLKVCESRRESISFFSFGRNSFQRLKSWSEIEEREIFAKSANPAGTPTGVLGAKTNRNDWLRFCQKTADYAEQLPLKVRDTKNVDLNNKWPPPIHPIKEIPYLSVRDAFEQFFSIWSCNPKPLFEFLWSWRILQNLNKFFFLICHA